MNPAFKKHLSSYSPFFVGLLLCFLGLILFGSTFDNEFCSDDLKIIVANPSIRNLNDIPRIWRAFNTRALTGWTFAFNYQMHRLQTVGYHLVNFLIHVAVSFLVYVLAVMIFRTPRLRTSALAVRSGPIALTAAMVYLLHPLQTQVVHLITQRATSLAVLFYLTAMIGYIRYRLQLGSWYYFAALLAMLFGVFTKEIIVTLPLMLTMGEYFFFAYDRRDWRQTIPRLIPFYLLAVLVQGLILFEHPDSLFDLKDQLFGRFFDIRYFWTEINVLRTCIRMLLLPLHQSHHYDYPLANGPLDGSVLFSLLVLTAVIGFAFIQFRSRRILTFCVVWISISLLPQILFVCFTNTTLLHDHWLYLGMVGYAIFLPSAAYYFFRDDKMLIAVFILLLVFLALLSYQRNRVWGSCISLWQDVVMKAPDDYLPYVNLGVAQTHRGEHQKAIEAYQRALDLYQGWDRKVVAQILVNLSAAFGRQGDYRREIYFGRQALMRDPDNSQAYSNLSLAYMIVGDKRKALQFGRKAVALDPDNADGYNNLGVFYAREGDLLTAADYFRQALKADPGHEQARLNYHQALGRFSLSP